MKAVVITTPGGPEVLQIQDIEAPTPGPGSIRVKVEATALNRADLLQRKGLYPAPPWARADVPGLEYTGVVETLGAGVTEFQVGDRVMGIIAGASYAEYVVVHAREAIKVPDALSWEEAAAIPEAFLTAYDAIWVQAGLGMGDTVLVHAAGSGVGTSIIQMARVCGARSIGTSRTASKLERCKELGMSDGILVEEGQFLEKLQKVAPAGVNAISDFVGGAYLDQNLQALKPKGIMMVIGLMGGREANFPLGTLLRKRLRVHGTALRARPLEEKIDLAQEFSARVMPHFASGAIKPVVDRVFAMEEVADAHRYMETNANFGKIILRW